ncbi:MAG TPA: SPOR domain-containing protein [Allosphingosinicella sp.]|jgi:Flp pilus assembly protein TadD
MNSKTLKFAVSALAIGSTMVACSPSATAYGPKTASLPAAEARAESDAASAYDKAQSAAKASDMVAALGHAERAVELSPRDIGYRMLLADLYLKNGRFASAETTFEDVLALDGGNVRAGLSIALTRIALGRTGGAIGQLDEMGGAPPADLGLAYALAGEHGRALQILEPAARAPGAAPRVRQNLALVYALSGDWAKAKTVAAQDIAPDQLAARMEQWARMAQPHESWDQVAALLGVTPGADEGQPARLALAPRADDGTAFAAAEPAQQPTAPQPTALALGGPAPEAAPEAVVEAAPEAKAWVSADASVDTVPEPAQAEEETRPVYAAAVESLVTPQAGIVPASAPKFHPAPAFERAAPKAKPAVRTALATPGAGRFVVQLGAFGSAAGVERAWASAYKRYGFSAHTPLSTTVKLGGGTFHRLSVAGFQSRGDATSACQKVKAKGGVCFVRAVAGDAPVRWASRYTGRNARG